MSKIPLGGARKSLGMLKSNLRQAASRGGNIGAVSEIISMEITKPESCDTFDAFTEVSASMEKAGIPLVSKPKLHDISFSAFEIHDMPYSELSKLYHYVNEMLAYTKWLMSVSRLQRDYYESKFAITLENRKTGIPKKTNDEREAAAMRDTLVVYYYKMYWKANTVFTTAESNVNRFSVYSDSLSREITIREHDLKAGKTQ